jgi:hypothetical protein
VPDGADIVSVDIGEPGTVTLKGLSVLVSPAGELVTASPIDPVKPSIPIAVMVELHEEPPAITVR